MTDLVQFIGIVVTVLLTGVSCVFVFVYAKYRALRDETDLPPDNGILEKPKKRKTKSKRGNRKRPTKR